MGNTFAALHLQLGRQISHWTRAAVSLKDLDSFAAPEAWEWLNRYLGLAVRQNLLESLGRLETQSFFLTGQLKAARTLQDLENVHKNLLLFRMRYFQTETLVDFYTHAINTRTNPHIASLLRACDTLAVMSMSCLLEQLGKKTPPVLTYLDKGLGASILKAGLRLWDGSLSPVATIKVVWHNLLRPTSLIHETGHQVAHISGWTEELSLLLSRELSKINHDVAGAWAGWASELAADAFAFAHTGYAAVAALHDVLAGDNSFVFRYEKWDPHPITFLRVLLGTVMCREFYGPGPWDDLAETWKSSHASTQAPEEIRDLINRSLPLLPKVVEILLSASMRSFGGRTLAKLINPERVKPSSLYELEARAGNSLYTSQHWIMSEGLRLLALSGLKSATIEDLSIVTKQQEEWMLRMGAAS